MYGLPLALVVLLVLLAIITLLGHGIWLVLAALFGGPKKPRRKCVYCDHLTLQSAGRCEWCGRDLQSPKAAELADLAAVERQLRRFRANHALKAEAVDSLLTRLQAYRQELTAPRAKPREEPVVAELAPVQPPPTRPKVVVPATGPVAAPPITPPIAAATIQPPAREDSAVPPVVERAPPPPLHPVAPPPAPAITTAHAAAAVSKPQPSTPKAPPPPRRSWTEMLAGFMEERNIRWGEVVGGLLFVCSSVALVVSLWDRLQTIRYFPFFIFVTVSSAVFGVGLYAHHRWKLESTSRGMLIIATLLVPLNFAAMAGPMKADWTADTVALVAQLVSLGLFAWLVGLAAKVLTPGAQWPAVLAVMGNSAAVLLVSRLVHSDSSFAMLLGIGVLPVGLFAAANLYHIRLQSAHGRPGVERPPVIDRIASLFTLLGITAFSVAVPIGLLVAQAGREGDLAKVLQPLSVLLAAAAMPVLAVALTVARATRRDKLLGPYHVAGTMIALVAMTAMLAAVGFAWPRPAWLIAVGVLNATALVYSAFRWRVPVLHAGAIACVALAYLTAFHQTIGHFNTTLDLTGKAVFDVLVGADSGTALAGLFLVLAAVSEGLARLGRRRHGVVYMGGATAVAIAGLVLVTFHGFHRGGPDSLRAAILYAVYGAGSMGLAARWRRAEFSYLGLALLAIAPLWALWWHAAEVSPLWAAVLAAESLWMAGLAVLLGRVFAGVWLDPWQQRFARPSSTADLFRVPLAHIAEVVAGAALAMTVSTAWFDRATLHRSPEPIAAAACLAAVCFLLGWVYRSAARIWTGSLIVLAAAAHALVFNYTGLVAAPWVVAMLGHATVALGAAIIAGFVVAASAGGRRAGSDDVLSASARVLNDARFLAQPLADSALLSSLLALPALVFTRSPGTWWLAVCFPWLATIWLVLAWRRRDAVLFAAHQAALAAGAVAAATVWLKHIGWVVSSQALPPEPNLLERLASVSHAVLKPRNLQAYGVVLAVLSILWILVRIVDRVMGGRAAPLLQARWTVDRVLRHAVVAAQLLLLALYVLPPEIAKELEAGTRVVSVSGITVAFGPLAWLLPAVLGVMLTIALWERWQEAELVSTLLLTAAAPCVAAGAAASDLAVASALRWGLAVAFIAVSVAVWQRQRLLGWCRGCGTRVEIGLEGPAAARAVLLIAMALPVLVLTLSAAMLQLAGTAPGGPLAGTWFEQLGPTWSYLVPLALVMGGMVGFALRERSTGYAFAAGLVLEMAVVLGYALRTQLAGLPFNVPFQVALLQLATIAAGAWAILWLVARNWVDVWREDSRHSPSPEAGGMRRVPAALMSVQIGMAVAGNVLLLGWALLTLVFAPLRWQAWTVAAGLPLGWLALGLPLVAAQLRGRLRVNTAGLFGMALLGLLACTIRGLSAYWGLEIEREWGYRALMLGWAAYALLVVLATWWVASLRTLSDAQGPPQALVRMAATWVRIAAIAAVLLGLKTTFWGTRDTSDPLWASAAIAVASAAGATMAVWRRREGWAFAAALGVNLAASIAVWHFEILGRHTFQEYWVRLVQANVIASAAVALVWLAARKRLYELRDLTVRESPLLGLQTAIPIAGNFALLMLPLAWLVHTPDWLPLWMAELAEPAGWIGLVLAAAAAAWYLWQTLPGNWMHVLGALVLGLGVLAACLTAPWDQPSRSSTQWLSYHVLVTTWAMAGIVVLGLAMAAKKFGSASQDGQGIAPLARGWLPLIGTLVVVLAVGHSFHDPGRPWWSGRAVLAMSAAAGLSALWLRQAMNVYVSGLLINVAGVLAWWAWRPEGPDALTAFVQTNVVCLAIGSALWLLLDRFHAPGVPHPDGGAGTGEAMDIGTLPYAHFAAVCGTGLLGLVVAFGLVTHLGLPDHATVGRLDWIALGSIAAAATIGLLDRTARFPVPSLYGLGIAAIAMGLWARELSPRALAMSAANEVGAFALVAAVLAWLLQRRREWFGQSQAVLVLLAAILGAWVAFDFTFNGIEPPLALFAPLGRFPGVLAILLALLAALAMSAGSEIKWRAFWQPIALGIGVLLLSGSGWAVLDADHLLLHRSVILMVAAAAMTLLAGFGPRLVVAGDSDWIERGRQSVPALAGAAALALIAVLAQEAVLFKPPDGTPMDLWAIGIVAAALLGLIGGLLAFAVLPALDPLRLSERGRQAYVYAAEVLAVLVGLHIRLTLPELFHGFLLKYWMFVVMGAAFAGAGLSEWFHRRRLPVLSQPLERTALLLPLLPALGFWFMPQDGLWSITGRTPALWFLMGLFYGILAVTRRSALCTVLAVATANLGLWVALHDYGVSFLHHPQFWLIPLALAGLVAEHLNRDRLTDAQRTAFRYLALSAIYISSTADMYIDWTLGLGREWQLPLVLMVLSVAGAMLGILLRVRSFLYLGVTFLTLDLVSMICHKAVEHPWIWYASGVALGAAIIAVFAVFEKRRNDVLAAVERLKEWRR